MVAVIDAGSKLYEATIEAVEAAAKKADGDRHTGILCVARALGAPARQIAGNSSMDGGVVLVEMRKGTGAYGFAAARNIYTDLVEAGTIDPTKVVRDALDNAVSVAEPLLLTEATMAEVSEVEDKPAQRDSKDYN